MAQFSSRSCIGGYSIKNTRTMTIETAHTMDSCINVQYLSTSKHNKTTRLRQKTQDFADKRIFTADNKEKQQQ